MVTEPVKCLKFDKLVQLKLLIKIIVWSSLRTHSVIRQTQNCLILNSDKLELSNRLLNQLSKQTNG